jgi:hypothetical protein
MMVGKTVEDINIHIPKDAYLHDKDQPTFKAYLTIIVRNEKGDIIKVHKQWSHSPTSNFIGLFLPTNWFINTGNTFAITDTAGTSYNHLITNGVNNNALYYPSTGNNFPSWLVMIQVGSGQQSNPYSAYSLAAPIANGTGTGQLLYGQPSVSQTPTVSGSSVYFVISQAFNNQSGGTVTISELGIIIDSYMYNINTGQVINFGYLLMWYDVLSSPISIPNGGSMVIYYTFTVNP